MDSVRSALADAIDAGNRFTIKLHGTQPAPPWIVDPGDNVATVNSDALSFYEDGSEYVIPLASLLYVKVIAQ